MDWILLRFTFCSAKHCNTFARAPTEFPVWKEREALFAFFCSIISLDKIRKRVAFFLLVSILFSRISKPYKRAADVLAIAAVFVSLFSTMFFAHAAVSIPSLMVHSGYSLKNSSHWRIAIG